jgi:hypothetical protein
MEDGYLKGATRQAKGSEIITHATLKAEECTQ